MDGNNSPASHGCRTPTKKAKRPPNYGGYHEEHSDGWYLIKTMIFIRTLFFSFRRSSS
jgi:hypothetical protein